MNDVHPKILCGQGHQKLEPYANEAQTSVLQLHFLLALGQRGENDACVESFQQPADPDAG